MRIPIFHFRLQFSMRYNRGDLIRAVGTDAVLCIRHTPHCMKLFNGEPAYSLQLTVHSGPPYDATLYIIQASLLEDESKFKLVSTDWQRDPKPQPRFHR